MNPFILPELFLTSSPDHFLTSFLSVPVINMKTLKIKKLLNNLKNKKTTTNENNKRWRKMKGKNEEKLDFSHKILPNTLFIEAPSS